MKIKLTSLLAAIVLFAGYSLKAQTVPSPGDLSSLTNLPTTSLSLETFGVEAGTVMHGASSFDSLLGGEYVFHQNFAIASELQLGTGTSVVDSAGLGAKIRKAWDAYEVYGLLLGRRDFSARTWQGVAGFGLAWMPAAGTSSTGFFSRACVFVDPIRLVIDSGSFQGRPHTESVAGFKFPF